MAVGAGQDILADESNVFVWTRATGQLTTYPIVAAAGDPLASPLVVNPPQTGLVSQDWDPPTAAPNIKHLVLLLGGRVWTEAAPEGGQIFGIELPATHRTLVAP